MWIRSQTKDILVDTKKLEILQSDEHMWAIQCLDDKNCDFLGFYTSEEKATKVLDEIQDCLLKHMKGLKFSPDIMHKINFVFAEPFVYQMPQDSEVADE